MRFKQLKVINLAIIISASLVLSCASKNDSSDEVRAEKNKSGLELKVTKKVLKNGLTILIQENHKLPIMSYYTYYKVGGKFEFDGITGASHFLEHMMFKGAKKYGPGQFDKIVEGNGGRNNAFTSNDHTVYYQSLPSEHLDKIIDLEADRMQNLLLDPVSFNKERQVVLEERRMRYENSDRGKIYLTMMKEMFVGTPYGTSVIGKVKDLKSVSRDQIHKYFKRYYAPNNAIIVIVGDVDAESTIAEIEEKFGSIPATSDLVEVKKAQLAKKNFDFKAKLNRSIKIKGQSPNPNFMLAFPAQKIGTQDAYILDILASILGEGESSYYSQKYVLTKRPTLANIYAGNFTLQDSGIFFFGGELLSKKSLKHTKKSLLKSLAKACREAITPRALQKIKNQYMVDMLGGLDTNSGIARFIGDREFYYKDYKFYKKEMGIYNSIDEAQLKATCKKYLVPKKSVFLSIWNKH